MPVYTRTSTFANTNGLWWRLRKMLCYKNLEHTSNRWNRFCIFSICSIKSRSQADTLMYWEGATTSTFKKKWKVNMYRKRHWVKTSKKVAVAKKLPDSYFCKKYKYQSLLSDPCSSDYTTVLYFLGFFLVTMTVVI